MLYNKCGVGHSCLANISPGARPADGDPWSLSRDFAPKCLQLKGLSSLKVNADSQTFLLLLGEISAYRMCPVEQDVFLVLFVAPSHCCTILGLCFQGTCVISALQHFCPTFSFYNQASLFAFALFGFVSFSLCCN